MSNTLEVSVDLKGFEAWPPLLRPPYGDFALTLKQLGFVALGENATHQELQLPDGWTINNLYGIDEKNRVRFAFVDVRIRFVPRFWHTVSVTGEEEICSYTLNEKGNLLTPIWYTTGLFSAKHKLLEKCPLYVSNDISVFLTAYWDEEIDFNS